MILWSVLLLVCFVVVVVDVVIVVVCGVNVVANLGVAFTALMFCVAGVTLVSFVCFLLL